MTDEPVSEQLSSDQPSATSSPQQPVNPASGTVINPELHGLAQVARKARLRSESTIALRLFPHPGDVEEDEQVGNPDGLELGHFIIKERIGIGSMGAVFRAADKRLQRTVALKIFAPEQSHDSYSVQRFQNEARAAARLDHENIARVHYVGEDQGLHFIAFEFVTGTNVRDLIHQQGRLNATDAVNYTLQIASALKHTAASGVVHRDIKPSNIIITQSGLAKLVDWGLARKQGRDASSDLTSVGTTLGTFDYISPEQAKDPRDVDVRSDIYSLGCTLYHMLTGQPPYPEGTVLQKLLDHQGKEPPDPAKMNDTVSEDLSAITRKMMASDPCHRYSTPGSLIRDLMLIAGAMGLRGVDPEGLVWMSSKPPAARFWERHLGWMASVVALLLVVVTLWYYPNITRDFGELNNSGSSDAVGELMINRSETTGNIVESTADSESASLLDNVTDVKDWSDSLGQSRTIEARLTTATDSRADTKSLPDAISGRLNDSNDNAKSEKRRQITPILERGDEVIVGSSKKLEQANNIAGFKLESLAKDDGVVVVPSVERLEFGRVRREPNISAEDPNPIWVKGSDGMLLKKYRTLEAACSEVQNGSTIELHFNGRRRERSLRISKKEITLRAAEGFQPVIEFVPVNIPAEGFQTQMIKLTAGPVNLNNLNLQLTISKDVDVDDGHIALICIQGQAKIRLQRVVIRVQNSSQSSATIFSLAAGPSPMLDKIKMIKKGMDREPLKFEITDCFFHGAGDLFVVKQNHPGEFSIKNSAVALDGSFLHVLGGIESPPDKGHLELEMEHASCLLGHSFVKMDSGRLPRELLPVHVSSARNNIFSTKSGSPLIAMMGNINDSDFRKMLYWSGQNNYYDKIETFWTFPSGQHPLDFEKWKQEWGPDEELGTRNEGIIWKNPDVKNSFSPLAPEDLTRQSADPATATDGTDVGADLKTLPRFPLTVVPKPESRPPILDPKLPTKVKPTPDSESYRGGNSNSLGQQ